MKNPFTIVLTVLTSFTAGIVAGLLISPRSGKENRQWIKEEAEDAMHWVEDTSSELLKKGEEKLSKVKSGVKEQLKKSTPDLYAATEKLTLENSDLEDA